LLGIDKIKNIISVDFVLEEQLEYVYTGLVRRGDNPIKKILIDIPRHMWSYPRRDLHKNRLK